MTCSKSARLQLVCVLLQALDLSCCDLGAVRERRNLEKMLAEVCTCQVVSCFKC